MADMPGMRAEVAWHTPPLQRPAPNLITPDQASLEQSVDGWDWPGNFYDTSTKTRVDTVASHGSWAMELTRGASAPPLLSVGLSDTTNQTQTVDWGDGYIWTGVPVTPGLLLTAVADFQAATVGRLAYIAFYFFDEAFNFLLTLVGPRVMDEPGEWVTAKTHVTAPAGSVWATTFIGIEDPDIGESHYVDRLGIIEDGGSWSLPGAELWTRIDESDHPDTKACLRRLEVTRGVRMKTAEIEAGEATAVFDNRNRALDPANDLSPYAPVSVRRRIRFAAETPRDAAAPELWPVFGGVINRVPTAWELADGWATLGALDMLSLLANETLDSAFERSLLGRTPYTAPSGWTYLPPAPDHWWRLDERSGDSFARDSIGSRHAIYQGSARGGGDPLLPYEGGAGNTFRGNTQFVGTFRGGSGRFVETYNFPSTLTLAFDIWFRIDDPPRPFDNSGTNEWTPLGLVRLGNVTGGDVLNPATIPRIDIGIWWSDDPDLHGKPWLRWFDPSQTPDTMETIGEPTHPFVADGQIHHIRAILTNQGTGGSGLQRWLIVDGIAVGRTEPAWTAPPPSPAKLRMGAFGITAGFSNTPEAERAWAGSATVAHIAAWTGLGDPGWIQLLDATGEHIPTALAPYDADLTGERINRVLDALGVDPADRDIHPGTTICGPAVWRGVNALEYLQRIAATEQGPFFVAADHRYTLRPRPANDPPASVTFAGRTDPLDPDVVPYAEITPDHSTDRLINVAQVSSDSLEHPVTVEDEASLQTYGPSGEGVSLDTVARDASTMRSIAARITARNHTPRTVIDHLDLTPLDPDVPEQAALGTELGDAAQVIATPPGPGDPLNQRSLIERIEQTFDYQAEDWTTGFGVAEHVVLPTLAWDTPGRGWDRSVWPEPTS